MSDMRRFESKIERLSGDIMSSIKAELNERDIGGGMHHATQIRDDIRKLHFELKEMQQRIGGTGGSALSGGGSTDIGLVPSDFLYYQYDNRYNLLPKNFEFPKLSLSSFISHYLLGNKTQNIPPFRILSVSDLKRSGSAEGKQTNMKTLSDMKKMMKFVEEAAREAGVWEDDVRNWNTSKVTNMFEKCCYRFHVPPKKGRRRFEQLVWKSYLNIIKDNNGLMPMRSSGLVQ